MSSLFDINFDKDGHKSRKTSSRGSSRRSSSPSKTSSITYYGNGETSTSAQDDVHIDSMQKKLLADQIRNRIQTKASLPAADIFGSYASKKRRGRPPKISSDECNLSPQELEVIVHSFTWKLLHLVCKLFSTLCYIEKKKSWINTYLYYRWIVFKLVLLSMKV